MRIINQPVNTVFIMDTSEQEIPPVQISRRAFLGKALFAGAGLAVLSAPDLAEAVLRTANDIAERAAQNGVRAGAVACSCL